MWHLSSYKFIKCYKEGIHQFIFVIRQLSEKYTEMNRTQYNSFIDFKQAFDSVWQEGLWRIMRRCDVPQELVGLIEDI